MSVKSSFLFSAGSPSSPLKPHQSEKKVTYVEQSQAGLEELMKKWGMRDPHKHILQRFTYQMCGKETEASAASGSTGKSEDVNAFSSRGHFHSGLGMDFLRDFFSSEVVRGHCEPIMGSEYTQGAGLHPVFRQLGTEWTSLSSFDRLSEEKIVRLPLRSSDEPVEDTHQEVAEAEAWARCAMRKDADRAGRGGVSVDLAGDGGILAAGEQRMPVVKRPEKCIRGDILVGDELRALLLDTYSCPEDLYRERVLASSTSFGEADDIEEDGDEDDPSFYSFSQGLSRRERARIFTAEERQEFLYHVLWRLVAGGGAMNQFEDDFGIYREAMRTFFRSLITSIRVTEEKPLSQDSIDDTESTEEKPVYVPQVQSLVFEVFGFSTGGKEGREKGKALSWLDATYSLWDRPEGIFPPNLNYCYVIVNPYQQQVVLWYNTL